MESPDAFDEEASEYDDAPLASSTGNKRARKSGSGPSTRAKGKGQSKKDDDGNDQVSVRKLQNRTAQREFRQRKLQYVKDLEARVEFLSSPQDDQFNILKALLHGFIDENKQLRALLQSVVGFIGSGIGGRATELGFNKDEDLDEFVKRSDKDTLHQLYEEWQAKLKEPGREHGGQGGDETKVEATDGAGSVKRNVGSGASNQPSARSSPARAVGSSTSGYVTNHNAEEMPRMKTREGTGSSTAAALSRTGHKALPSQSKGNESAEWPERSSTQAQAGQNLTNPIQNNVQGTGPNFAYNFAPITAVNTGSSPTSLVSNFDKPRDPLAISQGSGMQSSYTSGPTSSSTFFFDTADPMSMPMSAFTSDFLSEYINTGLTPMFDPASSGGFNWNPVDYATPSSTTSSSNSYHPIGQNMNDRMNPTRTATEQQRDEIRLNITNQITARHRARYNLPQGFTPADIINSNPMLAVYHLISSHLRNKAANPNYVLPEQLHPTPLQIATPHDFRIDGVMSKPYRDALIANTEYNLDELFSDMVDMVTIHPGEDLLNPVNSEFSETLVRKYRNVVTSDVIARANYWRRSRGEPDLDV